MITESQFFKMLRTSATCFLSCLLLATSTGVSAQGSTRPPMVWVAATGAGGLADIFSREVAKLITEKTGQVIVVDVSERRDSLITLVNPEIIERHGESDIEEGCLSVPGIYDTVPRAERVKVRAWDAFGKSFLLEAQGLLSVCIQHEMDHLKGKVFVEYLSQLKQTRVRARLAKQLRKSA